MFDIDDDGSDDPWDIPEVETEENRKLRRKRSALQPIINECEGIEDQEKANEFKEQLKRLPKPMKLRASKDLADIHSRLYNKQNVRQKNLATINDERKRLED